jgi:hypothetical protein
MQSGLVAAVEERAALDLPLSAVELGRAPSCPGDE